ncbi:unnamed protein product [Penicillium egyptiacum]|uniref:Plastocyanin-like domain-containing protein n=1 Tax=Penicillium egyptiacum TaxID=1303716 RepID=A0A9W4P5V8_9EURO|nr:unnamed protein product [Penicillium egyptiacum]
MSHPMHLHGHNFWVLGSGNGSFPYDSAKDAPESLINLRNPPYRDTTNLPPSGWAVIRYVTDNPGAWIFHCHIQWHMLVSTNARPSFLNNPKNFGLADITFFSFARAAWHLFLLKGRINFPP